jgi:microcystin-dependent protein
MSDQFLGEIRIFAGDFAINGWALCTGQILPISQYSALFSVLGTQYGGNGVSTFQLPNFQGVMPLDQGNGLGLTPRIVGETGGEPTVTLLNTEIPAHIHGLQSATTPATTSNPAGAYFTEGHWAAGQNKGVMATFNNANAAVTPLNPGTVLPAGGNQPHNNIMPFLAMTFIIALTGIYPSRG